MDDVKHVVSNFVRMLEDRQKEAAGMVDIVHQLQSFLEEESKSIIRRGLDRLLATITAEAEKMTERGRSRQLVVLISPERRVTVKESFGDENSDPWLARLKSDGFEVLTLDFFSSLIDYLKSEIAKGNKIPKIIEFLKANTKIEVPLTYLDTSLISTVEQPREPSTSSHWKPSDFLPARFPHPPLPRGFFRD